MQANWKDAKDFRALAREALAGNWFIAVAVGVVAGLLASTSNSPNLKVNLNDNTQNIHLALGDVPIVNDIPIVNIDIAHGRFLLGGTLYIMFVALALGLVFFLISSVVRVGYAQFNLDLMDRRPLSFGTLFEVYPRWKQLAIANFLQGLYTFLWMLLLLIPGIIAMYSYAMTPYILAERPELSPSEAIAASKAMMDGNRWRLFCLEFSFIGWGLLCAFTAGIGTLFLTPYTEAARAAFYREISGTWQSWEDAAPDVEYA